MPDSDKEPVKRKIQTMEEAQALWDAETSDKEEEVVSKVSEEPQPTIAEDVEVAQAMNPSEDVHARFEAAQAHIKRLESENQQLREQNTQSANTLTDMQQRLSALESRQQLSSDKEAPVEDSNELEEQAQEREAFLKDFPTLGSVVDWKIEQALKQHVGDKLQTVDELKQDRETQMRNFQLGQRYELANQRLNIVNAGEIDASDSWSQWVTASPHRLQIARDFAAKEDFVVLMREFLQQNPHLAKFAQGNEAPQKRSSGAPAQRTPTAAKRQNAARAKLNSNSTWAEAQSLWDTTPEEKVSERW